MYCKYNYCAGSNTVRSLLHYCLADGAASVLTVYQMMNGIAPIMGTVVQLPVHYVQQFVGWRLKSPPPVVKK